MIRPIFAWLEERFGIGALTVKLLSGRVDKKGAWLRTTGMACLAILILECISGVVMAAYYTPSTTEAHQSVTAMQASALSGFLRGIHHWGSASLIVLSGLTLVRMYFGGEYKNRRDIVWIVTLIFAQFALLFQLTGHILPWDTNAVATASTEAGIGGNVWVAGPYIKRLLLGGSDIGQATLTRWYAVHLAILPVGLAILVGLPLLLSRLSGGKDSISVPQDRPTDPYYPVHMCREMIVSMGAVVAIVLLSIMLPAQLEKPATAENLEGYRAVSEWYVLPMHAVTLIPPFNSARLEPLVTFVGPMLLLGLLFALPFLDRNPAKPLHKRPVAIFSGILALASMLGLSAYSLVSEGKAVEEHKVRTEAIKASTPARPAPADTALANRGREIYAKQGCNACHVIAGKGNAAGPELTHVAEDRSDRDWHVEHLINPAAKVQGSTMPAYKHLKPEELKALAEYMISLK